MTHLPQDMQSCLNLLFVLPTTNLPCSPQTHFRRTAKETTEQDTNVTDCNRLFPLAHQNCTTHATSRNTVRSGRYPENCKRTQKPTSTFYGTIGARTTQHKKKVLHKHWAHNSCFHAVFSLPLGNLQVIQKKQLTETKYSHSRAKIAELTTSRNTVRKWMHPATPTRAQPRHGISSNREETNVTLFSKQTKKNHISDKKTQASQNTHDFLCAKMKHNR